MFNRGLMVAAVTMGLGALTFAAAPAGKPTANPRCGVTFADRSEDAVRSDGRSSYQNGLDNVECQIWAGGSEDATLRLGKNTTRRFTIDYRNALSSNTPASVTPDGWFLNIRNIGTMAVGATKTTQAGMQAEGDSYMFRWCGGDTRCGGGADPGSTLVAVTRLSQTTWSVTTDLASGGDDIAVLLQPSKNTYRATGLYHLPFGLEIYCPVC